MSKVHDSRSARLILSTLDHVLERIDPALLVSQSVKLGSKLVVRGTEGKRVTLQDFDDIYVVGAGKASARMANSLCSILGPRVAKGAITVPYKKNYKLDNQFADLITVTEAAHPVPDSRGIIGTRRIIEIVSQATKNDLVVVLISGGGSALMPLPSGNLRLSDKQEVTDRLLRSGATINETNIVRKHLSAIKGGQLLRYVGEARVLSLILSDVVGDDISAIASGPTFPDGSTFSRALQIAKRYKVIDEGDRVEQHLEAGARGLIADTPKPGDPLFDRVHNVIIGNNATGCNAAVTFLRRHKVKSVYLGSRFDGEAREFGLFLARLSSDIMHRKVTNFALVLGGETTVSLKAARGKGGRNLEAGLSCVREIENGIVIAFMGTDGIDGNTDAAGSLISSYTRRLSQSKRISLQSYLGRHDSYNALKALNSLILTGRTGTNVNDIVIVCSRD